MRLLKYLIRHTFIFFVIALVLVIVHFMYTKATGTVVIAPPLFSQGLGFWREWALLKLTVAT